MHLVGRLFGYKSGAKDATISQPSQMDKKDSLCSETSQQKEKQSSTGGYERSLSVEKAKEADSYDEAARRRQFDIDRYHVRIETAEEILRNKDSTIAVQKCEIDCLSDALGVLHETYFENSSNRLIWQRRKIESLYSLIKVYRYRETLNAEENARLVKTVNERDKTLAEERRASELLAMELENAKRRLDLQNRSAAKDLEAAVETTRSARLESDRLRAESDRLRAESERIVQEINFLRDTLCDERRANQRLRQKVEWLQACRPPAGDRTWSDADRATRADNRERRRPDTKWSPPVAVSRKSRPLFAVHTGGVESSDSGRHDLPGAMTTSCRTASDSNGGGPGSGEENTRSAQSAIESSALSSAAVDSLHVRSLSVGRLSHDGSSNDSVVRHLSEATRVRLRSVSPSAAASAVIFSESDLTDGGESRASERDDLSDANDRTTITESVLDDSSSSFAESKEPSHDCISNYLTSFLATDSPGSKETLKGDMTSSNDD